MADNVNISLTVEAWADIVIKNWQRKIVELNIGASGALFDSFSHDVISSANGIPERIDFAYKFYGRFVDMGVGSGVYIGNPGNVKTQRKAKPWYSRVLYSEVLKLTELLAKKFSIIGSGIISENINAAERKQRKSGGDIANKRMLASYFPQNKSEISELDRIWMRRNGLLNE
jgi:hypothetical protein